MASRGIQRGFTLIEVVVAFSIAALVLGVLLQTFAGSLSRSAQLAEYRAALVVAESELARLGREVALEPGVGEQRRADGYHLRREVRPYEEGAAGALRPYRVTVTVSWPGPVEPRRVALTSVRLGEGT